MISLIFLILGVCFLVFGANFLVDGASCIAKKFNIPNMVIGLTIVAFGTSAPELVVNTISAINGKTAITLGNVVGSNIINILLILGVTAIIYPLTVSKNTVKIEIPICLFSAIITYILALDNVINKMDSAILLICFIFFLGYNVFLTLTNAEESDLEVKNYSLIVAIFVTILGLVLLIYGGKFIVNSAVELARNFGISERVISVTIVALGTSLPELATSVVAALKRNTDIAIGNVVGSNIFNIFFILGVSGMIAPVPIPDGAVLDLITNIIGSLLLFVFVVWKKRLSVMEGGIFLLVYSGYIYTLFK